MSIQLLYPNDPMSVRKPDEMYEEEYLAAKAAGLTVSLYSHEDLTSGQSALKGSLLPGVPVVMRGWMLPLETYALLAMQIDKAGASVLTSPAHYWACHHLSGWYSRLQEHTPATVFTVEDADYAAALAGKNWPGYFVKDYVKSLSTGRGSVCQSVEEIAEVVKALRHYRGQLEGGVAIRELETFVPDTEERYFVFQGKPFSRNGAVPELVKVAAARVDSPFFSVDTVMRSDGQLRVVELGDGQVSDRKSWSTSEFLTVLSQT